MMNGTQQLSEQYDMTRTEIDAFDRQVEAFGRTLPRREQLLVEWMLAHLQTLADAGSLEDADVRGFETQQNTRENMVCPVKVTMFGHELYSICLIDRTISTKVE